MNTAIGYFRFTKACMEYLESRSLISVNPWRKVKLQRVEYEKTPKPRLDEVNLILSSIASEYYVAACALAFLGCRAEALLRTKGEQVKKTAGYISIVPPPHRTKTVRRFVPIHPRLLKVLDTYKRLKSPYYFCDLRRRASGDRKMAAKNLNNAIKSAARKAGFAAGRAEEGFVAQSFRGFFKSHCIKQGIPREVVDVWQGHSDGTVGSRHYFDLNLEESIAFMQKVDFGS